MIILDTSGLLANYDRSDRHHPGVSKLLAVPQRRILSPFVLAELDYLVARIGGQGAELIVLEDVAAGAYELVSLSESDIAAAGALIQRYSDLELDLTDASLVVLAERFDCRDLLSLDQRHVRAVPGPGGLPFRLLPSDC